MKLSTELIENEIESNNCNGFLKEILQILLDSINDWPTAIYSVDEYFENIYCMFGIQEIAREELIEMKNKSNVLVDAWVIESISQLLDLYKFYESKKTLKCILKNLKKEVMCCD